MNTMNEMHNLKKILFKQIIISFIIEISSQLIKSAVGEI